MNYPKVGSALDDLIARVEAGETSPEDAAREAPLHLEDSVAVTIDLSGNVDGVVRFLEANGGSTISVGEDYIEALVPVLLVGQTSEQPGVLRVRLIQPPESFQSPSPVAGNGPEPHGSPAWNQAGYRGQGIKVGIIDNGFRGFSGLMGTELPATAAARCYRLGDEPSENLADCEGTEDYYFTDHGTAVAESVIDIAPNVSLYIARPISQGTMKEATDWMISEGVSVINHSVAWLYDGPGDGTSSVSVSPLNTVDTAVAAGIVWVNAAGNAAQQTWFKRGPFSYSTINVGDQERKVINFDGSDFSNGLNDPRGARIQLRWDDSWGGAARDLDLYVRNSAGDVVAASQDYQSGGLGQIPYEFIHFYGSGELLVADFSRSAPSWIQLTMWSIDALEHYTGTGSIASPAESANPGMLAVGAARWSNVDSIEYWSSRGPTPDGRVKPDVVGADCGQTATSSSFCGTSQAAPHVAGMVALVRQRFPEYTPAQAVAYIRENAEQRISSPDPNNTWGHGFFVLPQLTQELPGAPAIGSVTVGAGSLTVAWTAPSSDGGAAITAYDLRHIRSDAANKADANWTVAQDAWTSSGALSYELTGLDGGQQHDVQARAVNAAGDGPWSATVTGTPTQATPCATGGAVAGAANNPGLVSDCDTLLELRDTLAGTGMLNWSASTLMTNWDGVTVSGTPRRVAQLYLFNRGLTGTIPAELGSLIGLTQLTLVNSQLTGTIPSELGNLTNLTQLHLFSNRLTGSIPSELGRLTSLQGMELYDNRLTGSIPSELGDLNNLRALHVDSNQLTGTIPRGLGRLTNLQGLTLHDNQLTGEIPVELGRLTNLEQLYLSGNRFTGCVPAELRGVRETDRTHLLKDIGIPYCDVLLSGLSITPATLTTQFGAYITAYTATASASRITVTPSNRHNATFQYLDGTDRALTDTDGAQSGHQIDLPTGTTSTIKVKVTSGDGVASRVYTIQVTGPGALGPPAIGSVTPGAGSLTVAWRAPSQTGGSAITAYDLRHIRSDAPNKGDANWTVAQNTWTGSGSLQYVAIGLTSGTQYDVQVRAVNAAGDGPWSATAVGTITSTAPGGPTGLTATATGQTQIDLSWSAPSQTGGSAITGYLIEVSEDNSNWSNLESDTDSTSTSYSHTGLTAGTTRYYRVSAINSAGTGTASNTATGVTAPAGTPGAPAISSVTPGAGSLTVAWSTPSQTGGSAITAYDLRHIRSDAASKGDANWTVAQDVWTGSGALSYELTGLDGGVQYDVQARAVNSTGDGPWSATVSGTSTSTESTPGSPANAQYRREGSTMIVTWGPSAGATYYKVYYSDSRFPRCSLLSSGTSLGCEELAGNVAGTTYTHAGPDDDNNNYWITACNNAGCSDIDSANPAQFVDNRPVAPTNPQYRREGSTTVVTWDPAASAEYYKVYYDDFFGSSCRIGSGGSPSFCELLSGNVAGTAYTHTSPDDGANYYWITACNSAGCSDIDSANPAQLAASSPVATVPGAPTALTATANGQTQIDLSWSAPSSNGGADITGYRIEVSENGSTWTDLEASTGNAATSYSHTGLTAGSTRHYRVSAINSVGTSSASNTADATTSTTLVPDLVVDTPTVSDSAPAAGARFTLNATVRNPGSGASGSTTLRYYQSTDSTITIGDTEVGTDLVFRLGASASGDESISLTASSTAGIYYYGVCVDAVSDESDTTNNCSSAVAVTVGAAPAPDLVVDTPTVSESAPAAGASFTLDATVRNPGSGASDSTTLRYYRSTDSTITTGDTEVGTDPVFRLGASASGDESISLTAPSTSGTYYYGACVDSVSDESDTTNNCSSAVAVAVGAAPAPDVVLSTPRVSDSTPTAGASFVLNVTAENQGSVSSQPTTLRFYRSTDSTISSSDTELGTASVPLLGPGGGYVANANPAAPSSPGTYYYGACVDPVLGESDTTNNCSSAAAVTVGAALAPDLVVDTPTVSESAPAAGASFTLNATVRNPGNGASDSTTLRYYQSTDSTITTSDTEVGTDSVSGLNPSGSSDESISLTAPSTPGTYYYGACVGSVSDESNTTNNCSLAVTVAVGTAPAPDLVVDTPTVSNSSAIAGATFTLSATVRNQGNGASASTWLRFYHSSDATITSSDTLVSTNIYVDALNSSGSSAKWANLTAPSTAGTYYYGACVASVTGERDTMNNCSAALTLTVGTPDLVVDSPTVSDSASTAGARFMLSATVRNQGSVSSDSTVLRYYRSTDTNITADDTRVGSYVSGVDSLSSSSTSTLSINLTAPTTTGTYYYGACVDAVAGESDTTNNCSAAVTVTVGAASAPDLIVSTFTVDNSSPVPGQYFTLNATVNNQGNGSSSSTTLRYYRSTDATITTSDAIISTAGISGYLSVDGLSPSGSEAKSARTPAPSTLGTYYYGACVETVTGESDTTNNCSPAATVTVERTNQSPRLTGEVDDKVVELGESFTVDLSGLFTDPDGDEITSYGFTYRTRGILSGTVNTRTGILSLRAIAVGETIVAVDARDSNGQSGNSEDLFKVTVVAAEAADKPGAPTGLSATADGQTRIDLSWTAPSDEGGSKITGYRIEVSTDGLSWSDLVANTNATSTSYSHTGLTAGSARHYRVSAINSAGAGSATDVADATTDSPPAVTAPGEPTGLTATANGQTQIDLSWTAPSDNGGAAVTGYRIEVSTDGSSWSDLVANTNATSTSYSHTGLTAGSARHYRVSAINSVGTGSASNVDNATTDSAPAPRPTGAAVTGRITDCSGEQVTPGIDSYRITISGTLNANRAVSNVTVTGRFGGDFVGIDAVGSMTAGESASFSITGYVSESVGTCGAEIEWLEIT